MTTTRRLRPLLVLTLLWLALASPRVQALPANRSISLQGALGAPSPAVALQAGAWLDGAVEGTARLGLEAAARTGGRGAVLALAGLRWSPGDGRWRPALAVEAGLAWEGGPAAAATVRAGVERVLSRRWSVSAAAGLAWKGRGARPEGVLGLTCYF